MKVRMLVDISGTINGRPYPRRGEVDDFPTAVAEHLIGNRYAERVDPIDRHEPKKPAPQPEDIETASVDPVAEKAVRTATRPRKSPDA